MPFDLSWADVDPATHPFSATVDALAAIALPAVPKTDGKRSGWESDVTGRFVAKYGSWAHGWCWAVGEGTIGGGPVHAWCCASHSYTTQAATAQRCGAGLLDWRDWLELLARTFAGLDDLATASSRLVTLVAERTSAEDAWYAHCEQVLVWFLESRGASHDDAERAAGKALAGRFESWVAPSDELLADVDEKFAHSAERAIRIGKRR